MILKESLIISSFIVDRPFMFVIRDSKTGVVIFIGKVENPGE